MKQGSNYEIQIQQQRESGERVTVVGYLPEELEFGNTASWEAPFSEGLLGMLPGAVSSALKMFGVRPATQLLTVQVWQGTESNDLSFDLIFNTFSDPIKDVRQPVYDLMSMVVPSVDTAGFLLSPGPTLNPAKTKELVDSVMAQGKEISQSLGAFASQIGEGVGAAGLNLATTATGKTPDNYKTGTLNNTEKSAIPEKQTGVKASGTQAAAMKSQLTASIKNRISIAFGKLLLIRDIVIVSAVPRWNLTSLDAQTGLPNMCTVAVTVRPLFTVTTQDLEQMFQMSGSGSTYNNFEF